MPVDYEKMKQKQVKMAGGWRPRPGHNRIRILPFHSKYFTDAVDDFCYNYRVHYFRGDGLDTEIYRCPRDRNEFCVACEFYGRHKEAGDPMLKKAADQIRPSSAYLANILDVNAHTEGIQAYEFGWMVYKNLYQYACDPNWGDIMDTKAGRCYIITLNLPNQGTNRTGYNEYLVQPEPQATDVTGALPAGWQQAIDELAGRVPVYAEEARVRGILHLMGFPGARVPTSPMVVGHAVAGTAIRPGEGVVPVVLGPAPEVAAPFPFGADGGGSPVLTTPAQVVVVAAPVADVLTHSATPAIAAVGSGAVADSYPYAKGKPVPADAPVCFGDFNPHIHPCDDGPCPVKAECMTRCVGVD